MYEICRKDVAIRFCLLGASLLIASFATAQTPQSAHKTFQATSVFEQLDQADETGPTALAASWWDQHVTSPYRSETPLNADIHTLLFLALQNSNQIKIAKREPLIQQTVIQESDSAFDWVRYLNANWNDTSQPISNQLQAGGTASRLNDHIFQANGGLRRLTRYGGLLDISQQFGWQDNNSVFFVPADQATSQLTLSYTHPLLRGRGRSYNEALLVLAQIDTSIANQNFYAALQDELLEVTRSYWSLYRERAVLAHQMRLYLATKDVCETLQARQKVDTQGTQLITATSALANRRSDLIRARTAVTNAATRLRGLVNAPELANSDVAELIPVEVPSTHFEPVDLQAEIQLAIQNRPEVKAATQQVRAGAKRLNVAKHELLPALNLVTQAFANGLRGNNNFDRAFVDQFSTGAPSYTIGLQYELPVGNRLAKARVCRRQHEVQRLRDEYARALEAVQTEVDIAVRELNTASQEIYAKSSALVAAEAEANTIEQRWKRLVDGSGSAGLNLESLLRAQERVTAAEEDYVTSLLTYNLAMVSLKRATGTLLRSENVSVSHGCKAGCGDISLTKGFPVEREQNVFKEPMNFGDIPMTPSLLETSNSPTDVSLGMPAYGSFENSGPNSVPDYFAPAVPIEVPIPSFTPPVASTPLPASTAAVPTQTTIDLSRPTSTSATSQDPPVAPTAAGRFSQKFHDALNQSESKLDYFRRK